MQIRKLLQGIFLTIIILGLTSCGKTDPFKIESNHIGPLTDSTKVADLEHVFSQDSISKIGGSTAIDVFDKTGKKLLTLTPKIPLATTTVIRNVQIQDPRYKTSKGVSLMSTFKDIRESYKISKIKNLIRTIVIFVDEINASFTIDKEELPANLRFDMDLKIEQAHIPDGAKIKYFFVNWGS